MTEPIAGVGGSAYQTTKPRSTSHLDMSHTNNMPPKASKTSRLVNRFRRAGSSTGSSVHSASSNEDLRQEAGMTSAPHTEKRHEHLSPLAHSILVEQQKAAAELSARGNTDNTFLGTHSAAGTGSQDNLLHRQSMEHAARNPRTESPAIADQIAAQNRMHQSSSRLLRMTDDERPFTRVSQPGSSMRAMTSFRGENTITDWATCRTFRTYSRP